MKVTSIKQQLKRTDRYSIYVDGVYSFSLSENALLESKLASGQELSREQVKDYKKLSNEDKLYNQVLRYLSLRLRSVWEVETYLERKGSSPALSQEILNKLSNLGLTDDSKYAEAYVSTRRQLRPTSRRKMIAELRQKHISGEVIEATLGQQIDDEQAALLAVIERKRRQLKYRDNTKLMQYLARQGFNYEDIKNALADS